MKFTTVHFLKILSVIIFGSGYFSTVHTATAISASPRMDIIIDDNLISVVLIDAPFVDVLNRIERDAGFVTHLFGDLSDNLTISYTDMPLDKGLRRMAGKHSVSFIYHPLSSLPKAGTSKTIAEVWIFEGRSAGRQYAKAVEDQLNSKSGEEDTAIGDEYKMNDEMSEISAADLTRIKQEFSKLSEEGDTASVMAMATYLSNDDKEVRKMVINGIGSIQREKSVQILGQVLYGDPDPEIRMMAARSLAAKKNNNVAKALLESAVDDPDEEVQALVSQLLSADNDN